MGAPTWLVEESLHGGNGRGLILRYVLAGQIAGGKDDEDGRNDARDDAHLEEDAAVLLAAALQQIEGAHGGHDERAGDDRAGHVVHVLEERPGIHQQLPEAEHFEMPVGHAGVADGMLHPRVGDDDEEAGDPRAEPDHDRGEPVQALRDALFAVKEEAEKRRLEKEAEDAFHGQRLADDAARKPGEARPVGAELELHGNAGNHAHDEVDAEDAAPETRRAIPYFAARAQRHRLERDDEQSQAHGELRKQIVEGDGEGKMQPVDDLGVHQKPPGVIRAVDGQRVRAERLSATVRCEPTGKILGMAANGSFHPRSRF